MALTASDLANLESAMASGELEVEMDGRRVKFASAADLQQRIAYVRGVLAASGTDPTTARRRSSYRFAFGMQRGD